MTDLCLAWGYDSETTVCDIAWTYAMLCFLERYGTMLRSDLCATHSFVQYMQRKIQALQDDEDLTAKPQDKYVYEFLAEFWLKVMYEVSEGPPNLSEIAMQFIDRYHKLIQDLDVVSNAVPLCYDSSNTS